MGCFTSKSLDNLENEKQKHLTPNDRQKCMIQLKMQRDKISRRIKDFEKQIDLNHNKAKQLAKEKKKDQAIYYLAKKRMMMQNHQKFNKRVLMVEGRINQMENVMDDLEFTKMMNESNNQMRELMEEVDYSALEEANEISKDVDFNNQQVLDMIGENQDEDMLKEFEMLGTEESPENLNVDKNTNNTNKNQHNVNDNKQNYQSEEQQMMIA